MKCEGDCLEKAKLKMEGLDLEEKNWRKASIFYEKLLSHPFFANDYYIYRRLIICYDEIKDFKRQYEIIKSFFYSNIYCHNNQVIWMRNKLLLLIKRKFTTEKEINDFIEYYKENGLNNKEKSNYPVVIADRIDLTGKPEIISESRYDFKQNKYEWENKATGFTIAGKYQEAIDTYEEMIENKFYSYVYYQKLYFLYRDMEDYENAERVITAYFNGESTQTPYSESKFEYYREELNALKNNQLEPEETKILIVYPDEDFSDSDVLIESVEDLNDENVPDYDFVPEGNYFEELKLSDPFKEYDNQYLFTFPLDKKYNVNINKPLIYYEYNKNLSMEDNIQRKYYLKRYINELTNKYRFRDAIEILEKLKENNYFENDWYIYKRLSILHEKFDYYNEGLENIKELFYSGIWLNDHHIAFFKNKFKIFEKRMFIDENKSLDCIDYYKKHGALNKSKSDTPVFLADKISGAGRKNMVSVDSEERFDEMQIQKEIRQSARVAEIEGDFITAVDYYLLLIDGGVNNVKIYKQLVYCLEILDEYDAIFNTLKHYKINNKRIYPKNRKWVKRKLELINSNLGTNYTFNDLKD